LRIEPTNRTGDQTRFRFSHCHHDSVSNFAQAYLQAIQDKEATPSVLRIKSPYRSSDRCVTCTRRLARQFLAQDLSRDLLRISC